MSILVPEIRANWRLALSMLAMMLFPLGVVSTICGILAVCATAAGQSDVYVWYGLGAYCVGMGLVVLSVIWRP
ncbi:MAG TPA: hypothetical protein VLE72_03565 [Candidatus Saccharimonadales bacterium]|nr:hypothetical protein [Candidatus Saccharimonadales bacterium]